jgi:tRNA(adenine34) deaminase
MACAALEVRQASPLYRTALVNPRPTDEPLDTQMLRRCIELSRQATHRGENPFACIICDGDRIVAEATTRAARDGDISRHAEMLAIADAQQAVGTAKLARCTLYSTVEPCAMCSFCIRETNIRRVVYSIASPVMGGYSKWNILGDTELSDALPEVFGTPPEIVAGLLAAEAEQVWRDWHPLDWAILQHRRAMGNNHDGVTHAPAGTGAPPAVWGSVWRAVRSWLGADRPSEPRGR